MVKASGMVDTSEVEVVFSPAPGREEHVTVKLTPGEDVAALIDASGLPVRYPAFDFAGALVGIWGKLVPRDTVARAHDRIEIYRPLMVDPKVARTRRAQKKNKGKPAGAGSAPPL